MRTVTEILKDLHKVTVQANACGDSEKGDDLCDTLVARMGDIEEELAATCAVTRDELVGKIRALADNLADGNTICEFDWQMALGIVRDIAFDQNTESVLSESMLAMYRATGRLKRCNSESVEAIYQRFLEEIKKQRPPEAAE